jgi:hypothetical protein
VCGHARGLSVAGTGNQCPVLAGYGRAPAAGGIRTRAAHLEDVVTHSLQHHIKRSQCVTVKRDRPIRRDLTSYDRVTK